MRTQILKKKLLIFADGTGELFTAICEACKNHTLSAEVIGLVSSLPKAEVLKKAVKKNIQTKTFPIKNYSNRDQWDKALCDYCKKQNPYLIVMAGFLKKLGPRLLSAFPHRVVNIHPSLLPRHGGKGMYGLHVHQSVIEAGDKVTGISIHLASNVYDVGAVLAQKTILVSSTDTAQSLQIKVKQSEKVFYVSTLKKILQGEISLSPKNAVLNPQPKA